MLACRGSHSKCWAASNSRPPSARSYTPVLVASAGPMCYVRHHCMYLAQLSHGALGGVVPSHFCMLLVSLRRRHSYVNSFGSTGSRHIAMISEAAS